MIVRVIGMFLLISFYHLGFSATMTAMTMEQKGQTSIVCTLTNKTNYRLFTLNQPNRVVLDLSQTKLATSPARVSNPIVTAVRTGHPDEKTVRLVFDVNQNVSPQATWRVLANSVQLQIILNTRSAKTSISNPSYKIPPEPIKQIPPGRGLRDVVVVIDPGHGGKDPGAMGPRKSTEKTVVLAIAAKLKQMIDRQPGMRAVLTRNGDYYIGLRERLDIARKYNADIFIAIHADAFINQHSNGASVFALSQRGATSEAARWLAEKENYSELGGVNLSGLDDESGMIRTVLLDLSQTATINAGLQMGGYILQYLAKMTNLHNVKVEQARFVVLKSPDIPSVLVETGFISNPNEERNLINPSYQMRLSQAIFEGVKRYFYEHPIQGTRLDAMMVRNTHLLRAENHQSWFDRINRRA